MRIKNLTDKIQDAAASVRLPPGIVNAPVNKYAFMAQRQNGDTVYLDKDGFTTTIKQIVFWDGTSCQARAEARIRGEKFGQLFKEKLKSVTFQKLNIRAMNNPNNLQEHLDRLNKTIALIQATRGNNGENRKPDPE